MDIQFSPQKVYRTLTFTALIAVAEPLSATILFPFVYFMVKSFNSVEETSVGLWCGVITSCFFLAQMVTAPIYGILSDRFGRRPLQIYGIFGSGFFMLCFGFSKNIAWAIISRSFCGLLNGNTGVSRTSIGELSAHANLDSARTMGMFGICTAIGTVLGPLIGGWLSMPTENYNVEGPFQIFKNFPFLLPCVVGSSYNILVGILAFMFLPETNINTGLKSNDQESVHNSLNENTPILQSADDEEDVKNQSRYKPSKQIYCLISTQGIIALHNIVFDEMYPIIAASKGRSGFGIDSKAIGFSLFIMAPVLLLVQMFGYPWLTKRFTQINLCSVSSLMFIVVYGTFPLLARLWKAGAPSGSVSSWVALAVLLDLRISAAIIAYTSAIILLLQATPAHNRGFVMGLATMVVSAARATGPALAGALWSLGLKGNAPFPFNENMIYVLEVSLSFLQLFVLLRYVMKEFTSAVQSNDGYGSMQQEQQN